MIYRFTNGAFRPLPFPIAIALSLISGVAAAIAARTEIRARPRSAFLTQSFGAYMIFMLTLFVPGFLYFYLFHGDWFLLYAVDTDFVPSVLVLLGFLFLVALGGVGFGVGAKLARQHQEIWSALLIFVTTVAGGASLIPLWGRVSWVGSRAEFRAGAEGQSFAESSLFYGALLVGLLLMAGLTHLMFQLIRHGRRG